MSDCDDAPDTERDDYASEERRLLSSIGMVWESSTEEMRGDDWAHAPNELWGAE